MSNLNDEQLFYVNLDKIIDGEVPSESKSKIDQMLKDPKYAEIVEKFREAQGRLQNSLEGQYLDEEESLALRGNVLDLKELAAVEEAEIESLGSAHKLRSTVRNLLIYGVLMFLGYQFAQLFLPSKEVKFAPLESFYYETLAFEEDLGDRIDMRTDSLDDVKEFFKNYPDFYASNATLADVKGWNLEGASVIDYEIAKIGAVVYTKPIPGQKDTIIEEKERFDENGLPLPTKEVKTRVQSKDILVQYSFQSDYNRFPEVEFTKAGSLEFSTYESDKLNMIMWREDDLYHVMSGRIAPVEMAKFAASR